jgi:hypothetical protein
MIMALTPPELQKLAAILEMLSSSFEHERAAAALKATQFVRAREMRWVELLHTEPPPPVVVREQAPRYWRHTAQEVRDEHSGALNSWEADFLKDILRRGYALSANQATKLRQIAAKTGVPTW